MKRIITLFTLIAASITFAQNNVTFQVDLSEYTGTYPQFPTDTVNLNGTFNNWCGSCAIMSDANNDSIFEITVDLPTDSIEFKFTINGWAFDEQFSPGMPCTKTSGNFTNRFFNVTGDTTLPAYCWETCSECGGMPLTRDVTFQVDLSEYSGSYTEVNLNGTFNNWCGSCAVMTDPDGDMVYELMVNVSTDSIEYKFTLDGWTVDEQFAGGEPCTVTDPTGAFTNRVLGPGADTTLPAVCWESCDACGVIGLNEADLGAFEMAPNPTSGVLNITGQLFQDNNYSITVTDLTGKVLLNTTQNGSDLNDEIDLSSFQNGIYLVSIHTTKGSYTERIILNK
jgi:polyisoprenoid-binding protein YceI